MKSITPKMIPTPTQATTNPTPESSIKKAWLDVQAAVKELNISRRTLQNWRNKGIISFSKLGGKPYYCAKDILRKLEENRRNSKIS